MPITPIDIVAAGECLVDFLSAEKEGKLMLEGHPGGAPANVLAMAARLGCSTQLIAKVGADAFGDYLVRQLQDAQVGTRGVARSARHPTTLAIVSLNDKGDRDFSFYRNATADVQLEEKDLDAGLLKNCRIFHFGSVSLTAEPSRSTTLNAAQRAKANGAMISCDPNLRPPLWASLDNAKEWILEALKLADATKLSGEEMIFLEGSDSEAAMRRLAERFGLQLLTVTLGAGGCRCLANGRVFESRAYAVSSIDTTGAGDAFWGAMLAALLEHRKPISELTEAQIASMLDFANAAGSLATTKKGAIPAMPERDAIVACMGTIPRLIID